MYWTLDTRRPNLDEIIYEGANRIRAAVEAVCARYDAPQLEVPYQGEVCLATQAEAAACSNKPFTPMALAQRLVANYMDTLERERRRVFFPGEYIEFLGGTSISEMQRYVDAQRLAGLQNAQPSSLLGEPNAFGSAAAAQQGLGRASPNAFPFLQ